MAVIECVKFPSYTLSCWTEWSTAFSHASQCEHTWRTQILSNVKCFIQNTAIWNTALLFFLFLFFSILPLTFNGLQQQKYILFAFTKSSETLTLIVPLLLTVFMNAAIPIAAVLTVSLASPFTVTLPKSV